MALFLVEDAEKLGVPCMIDNNVYTVARVNVKQGIGVHECTTGL